MKSIGIIVAMKEEHLEVYKKIKNKEEIKIGNLDFTKGTISKRDVILVKCGVGKVNSARTTTKLLDMFDIDIVINPGSAGAINDELNIGDIVISKENIQHDFDITAFGYEKGYISEIGRDIHSNIELVKYAEKLVKNCSLGEYKTKVGTIASGDIFCHSKDMKDKIKKKFNADVVDMECSAIAQVCYLENIPFISIRSVSDSPNGNNAKTFDENLELASKRAAEILEEFCKDYEGI